MNKPIKMFTLVALFASATTVAIAQTDVKAPGPGDGYVKDARGVVVRDPFGLCVRTGYFTPALATVECDPDLVPKAPPPPPVVSPEPAPPARVAPPAPVTEKVTLRAETLFDFDKSVLKPAGKAAIDAQLSQTDSINLEVIIGVGHTDSIGSDAYNQKLSVKRAGAVKAYIVGKGVDPNRVYAEGKGESQPVEPNTINGKDNPAGRAKNRRVEIEVVGTRK